MRADIDFALWPILPYGMEDGDGDGGKDGSDSNSDNSSNNQGGQDNLDADGDDDDDDDDDDDLDGLTAKELRRIAKDNAKKARDAEKARAAAEGQLSAKEREKLDKDQRNELDLNESRARETALKAVNSRLAIINGILMTPGFEWHNPEIVAGLLNSEIVKVDSDGKVEGLKNELNRISKDHAYLLKSKAKTNDASKNKGNNGSGQQNNQNGNQQQNGQATGQQPGQGGASGGGTLDPDKAQLVANMPALSGRV